MSTLSGVLALIGFVGILAGFLTDNAALFVVGVISLMGMALLDWFRRAG